MLRLVQLPYIELSNIILQDFKSQYNFHLLNVPLLIWGYQNENFISQYNFHVLNVPLLIWGYQDEIFICQYKFIYCTFHYQFGDIKMKFSSVSTNLFIVHSIINLGISR
jgi:hypothetical protein